MRGGQGARSRRFGRLVGIGFVLGALLVSGCGSSPPPTTSATPSTPAASFSGTPDPARTGEPIATPAAPTGQPGSPTPAASASASPADLATELVAPGSLTICAALLGPPAASLTDEGHPDGYNIAFGREIATRLELEPVFVTPEFSALPDYLAEHRCDMSISSQNITPSREAAMSMLRYTRSQQPVLVEKGNPKHIMELADMCGRPVSAAEGSTHVDLVNGTGDFSDTGLRQQCAAEGEEPVELHTFGSEAEALDALLDGDVIAYLGNPNFIYEYPDLLDYAQVSLPAAEQGIATALDRPLLTAAVAEALDAMIGDETYLAILRHYLPNEESVQVVSITE